MTFERFSKWYQIVVYVCEMQTNTKIEKETTYFYSLDLSFNTHIDDL
jgi:hypothetical protein